MLSLGEHTTFGANRWLRRLKTVLSRVQIPPASSQALPGQKPQVACEATVKFAASKQARSRELLVSQAKPARNIAAELLAAPKEPRLLWRKSRTKNSSGFSARVQKTPKAPVAGRYCVAGALKKLSGAAGRRAAVAGVLVRRQRASSAELLRALCAAQAFLRASGHASRIGLGVLDRLVDPADLDAENREDDERSDQDDHERDDDLHGARNGFPPGCAHSKLLPEASLNSRWLCFGLNPRAQSRACSAQALPPAGG